MVKLQAAMQFDKEESKQEEEEGEARNREFIKNKQIIDEAEENEEMPEEQQ